MLGWTIAFLIIALVAALLGFTGIEIISVEIARVLFFHLYSALRYFADFRDQDEATSPALIQKWLGLI